MPIRSSSFGATDTVVLVPTNVVMVCPGKLAVKDPPTVNVFAVIEAVVEDEKAEAVHFRARPTVGAGEFMHRMTLAFLIDGDYAIRDVRARTIDAPWPAGAFSNSLPGCRNADTSKLRPPWLRRSRPSLVGKS